MNVSSIDDVSSIEDTGSSIDDVSSIDDTRHISDNTDGSILGATSLHAGFAYLQIQFVNRFTHTP